MKTLPLLIFLTLIGCGSDKPYRAFDGQAAKVKWLTYWTCEEIDIETQLIKKDTLGYDGYERYEDPQYSSKSYNRIKTSTVEHWNGEGGWEALSDSYTEFELKGYDLKTIPENQKNKFLNAAIEDVPDINNLNCKETVSEWHKAVNKRLQEGAYKKTLFNSVYSSIDDSPTLACVIFLTYAATLRSYKAFKKFVFTKSLVALFLATTLSGAFGIIAVLIKDIFNSTYIDSLSLWAISTAIFIFISIVAAIMLDKNR